MLVCFGVVCHYLCAMHNRGIFVSIHAFCGVKIFVVFCLMSFCYLASLVHFTCHSKIRFPTEVYI